MRENENSIFNLNKPYAITLIFLTDHKFRMGQYDLKPLERVNRHAYAWLRPTYSNNPHIKLTVNR